MIEKKQIRRCIKCGAVNPLWNKNCIACGAELIKEEFVKTK
jgi:ribosomal protein L40E